ncbi:hypothetical protein SAMN05216248_1011020 [Pseudomonas simiae]|nr:hypothetical protein SAMN05216248_1011020 [Pseudomonas simiae]
MVHDSKFVPDRQHGAGISAWYVNDVGLLKE